MAARHLLPSVRLSHWAIPMPELRRFVWGYESLLARLRVVQPRLADLLEQSCRPIAAERRPDGRLTLVLGCWVPSDRAELAKPGNIATLEVALKRLMDEPIQVIVAQWPGGDAGRGEPPDPLRGLPPAAQAIGAQCGSAIHRAFFAAAFRRGLRFRCQYPVLNYRIDFALPSNRLGVEIGGWAWRSWTRGHQVGLRDREQALGAEGWRILWFTGQEVLENPERCVDQVQAALKRGRQA